MKIVFWNDPIEKINPNKDTGYIFMLEALKRGHKIYFLPSGGLTLKKGKVFFAVIPLKPAKKNGVLFEQGACEQLSQDEIQALIIRKEPPFDSDYLMHTWLLERCSDSVFMMNDPAGLRIVNEKIWVTQFSDMIPATVVTRSLSEYEAFLKAHKDIVLKPCQGFGGQGIFRVSKDDTNKDVIFETMTEQGRVDVVLQAYLKAAQEEGDKRILLLNGDILGAVMRVNEQGGHRNNFMAGGKAKEARITPRDHKIVEALKPYLQELGLYFVGIDIIGGQLIEVNVTSPTCLQEMNRLQNTHLEAQVLDFVEAFVMGPEE